MYKIITHAGKVQMRAEHTCTMYIYDSMYYIQKGRGGGVVFNEPIAHILYGARARAVPGNHAHFVSAACPTPRCILTGSFWHLS